MFRKLFGVKTPRDGKADPAAAPPEAHSAAPPIVDDRARAEARANPGGWVYALGGGYNDSEAVPPHAVKGAWKVNDAGEIVGDFIQNPNYDPTFRKPG